MAIYTTKHQHRQQQPQQQQQQPTPPPPPPLPRYDYEADFTLEEEELLVALLNQYEQDLDVDAVVAARLDKLNSHDSNHHTSNHNHPDHSTHLNSNSNSNHDLNNSRLLRRAGRAERAEGPGTGTGIATRIGTGAAGTGAAGTGAAGPGTTGTGTGTTISLTTLASPSSTTTGPPTRAPARTTSTADASTEPFSTEIETDHAGRVLLPVLVRESRQLIEDNRHVHRPPSSSENLLQPVDHRQQEQQQEQREHRQPSQPSQQSSGGGFGSLRSLLSFPSTAAFDELLELAVFPTEIQLAVPKQQQQQQSSASSSSKEEVSRPDAVTATARGLPSSSSDNDDATTDQHVKDTKSDKSSLPPITRWRSYKPLSVTDLVSPAWCELQYQLSLTHHGRKKRTTAMKKGSAVHQELEEEVHAIIQVAVTSREDTWALRLWNIIEGARRLRETGLTRELEVWGVIHGQLVNGIIDQLSYECNDPGLEKQAAASTSAGEDGDGRQQQSIENFFKARDAEPGKTRSKSKGKGADRAGNSKAYLTDIKTRTVRTLPRGSTFRPTKMQLMLYHRMLDDLAAGRLDPERIWKRYDLDADAAFTETFIAQFAPAEDDPFYTPPSSSPVSSLASSPSSLYPSQDAQSRGDAWLQPADNSLPSTAHTQESAMLGGRSVDSITRSWTADVSQETEPTHLTATLEDLHSMLRGHNSLRKLWDRMLAELSTALPDGLGKVLTAEYRSQADRDDVIGRTSFVFDGDTLDAYLTKTMQWWEGERKAEGVNVEEAWKCGGCEFAEGCEWRESKVAEATKRFRERKSAGGR